MSYSYFIARSADKIALTQSLRIISYYLRDGRSCNRNDGAPRHGIDPERLSKEDR